MGLISRDRYDEFLEKMSLIESEIERISSITVSPSVANPILEINNCTPIKSGVRLSELIKRPELDYEKLKEADPTRPELPADVCEEAEIKLKYDGYIKRQMSQAAQTRKMESRQLPDTINYSEIYGLRLEARQKLEKIRPNSLGQASRISGVSPADISVLIIWLEAYNKNKD